MIELFRERDITKVHYYQSLLESAGIATFVRNEHLSTAEGVCIPDFFPALCILNETDQIAAVEIIRNHLGKEVNQSPEEVLCESCAETSPGNFETCWNCGSALKVR